MNKTILVLTVCLLTSCKSEKNSMEQVRDTAGYIKITNAHEACLVYPKTMEEMEYRVEQAKKRIENIVHEICACTQEKQNKKTMIYALDSVAGSSFELSVLEFVQHVYADSAMQKRALELSTELQDFYTDMVEMNSALYQAFKTYNEHTAQHELLHDYERYFLDELLSDFKRVGLDLPEDKQIKARELYKKINKVGQTFVYNINADTSSITASKEELAGVPEDFITSLPKNDDGIYTLATDYPTQAMVMNYCSVQETRKRFSFAFNNRAYPQNKEILDELIALRNEYARLLGYESYAALDLDNQMIKTVDHAWKFENDLKDRAITKAKKEFKKLTADLPEGVQLAKDGRMYSWDGGYVSTYFKKKYYSIDEQELAEYFPMEKTIAGLMHIYEQFFSIKIRRIKPEHMWHPDVELLEISDAHEGTILGYIFLDMFPRQSKFSHAAQFGGIQARLTEQGVRYPAVVAVVCNFTKPTAHKPSLLKYDEVNTFFHEFGHAIHSVLGATKLATQSGTNVKNDFVELPSQMLENWLEDRDIVKNLSCHYVTGKQLPDTLLDKKLELLQFGLGMHAVTQLMYAMISLEYFGPSDSKDTDAIWKSYAQELLPYSVYDATMHRQYSFGHLFDYAAKYYGYMWADVLGQDVFAEIKKGGLLNPRMGEKYVSCILAKGGSKDPNQMLIDFLGREPNADAFFKKMGL